MFNFSNFSLKYTRYDEIWVQRYHQIVVGTYHQSLAASPRIRGRSQLDVRGAQAGCGGQGEVSWRSKFLETSPVGFASSTWSPNQDWDFVVVILKMILSYFVISLGMEDQAILDRWLSDFLVASISVE